METLQEAAGTAMLAAAAEPGEQAFYFIGELAEKTGLDPKTIRFYERAGLLSPPRHGRFRTYLKADVERLVNVITLRRLGVPLARIRDILALEGDSTGPGAHPRALRILESHLKMLRRKQSELELQITQTEVALALNRPPAPAA